MECSTCPNKATRRIQGIYLCTSCAQTTAHEVKRRGVNVVESEVLSEARRNAMRAIHAAANEKVHFIVAWYATSKEEYERGIELGLIPDRYVSWEHYEAYWAEVVANTPMLRRPSATPDEIMDVLIDSDLDNTPHNRLQVELSIYYQSCADQQDQL